MLNRDVFNKGMGLLMASFPEYQCTPETVEAYWTFLKDFDPNDFKKVITNHIKQNKWFPKISELNEELVRLKGFHRPTATDAWDSLLRAAESGEKPELDENTERALAVCGGWDTFQFMSYRDLQFHRKDFERQYNEGLERQDRQLKVGHDVPERLRIADRRGKP